ncbi:MAG: type II toxin-antitoxin system VapB family antitoxin [Defluviitaleaceae bacterium]|nr:type II toxin-antitoxin system VapB family antitoxin [Defluviitaleaceae bacterium]
MTKTKSMSINISESEYEEIKSFADFQGESISDLVLNAVREQMELWEDLKDIAERKDEPTSSLAEVRKRLGLCNV